MRAHVEVDATVHEACLDAVLVLQARYKGVCDIHISGQFQGTHTLGLCLTSIRQCSLKIHCLSKMAPRTKTIEL
jgi:hypothetical protein